MCAPWVHERHEVVRDGRRYATWHPPRDPRYGCAFGHEHGSNPRAFFAFRRAGMPAFGAIGAAAAQDEAHAGFKVFVANDDRKGLGWMMVLHQGTGGPRRGAVRFHSLEAWLVRRDGALIAHAGRMADFGRAVANCPRARRYASMRLLPHPACRSGYEEWTTALDVGGALRASPGFGVDNAITQLDPSRPAAIIFNKGLVCGPFAPGGWRSRCKGDRRTVFHPRWRVGNRGPSEFRTDAFGRRSAAGPLRQFVSSRIRVDQGRECCGIENAFVMERPSDGGIYRAGRGLESANFEHRGYCVLRSN